MKKAVIGVLILTVLAVATGYILTLQKNPVLQNVKNQLKNPVTQNQQQSDEPLNFQNLPTEKPVEQGISLQIVEPKENAVFSNSNIKITGKTASLVEVFVNDKQTKADENGNFYLDYSLDEGENLLTVAANDKNGNYAEKEIVVMLETVK
ncbi:MAG: hypothetical protein Fur009_1660 [Candidatus Microgenomates bacterium]